MTNKFEINGIEVFAEYNGGQSRNGDYAVDYELVRIGDVELYAEIRHSDDTDYDECNSDSFETLSAEIARQAEEKGIDLDYYNPIFG